MIELAMLSGPIIGAIIGYGTNWIAVKMLFHPRKPIAVFGKTLPFTPGIIPKRQPKLAKAIAATVSNQLLTEEALKGMLLTDEMKDKISCSVLQFVENQTDNRTSLHQVSDKIGDGIASMIIHALNDVVKGTFLAMMVNESTLENLRPLVTEKIGKITLGEIATLTVDSGADIGGLAEKIYVDLLEKHLSDLLKVLDLEGMIEKKVAELDVMELERLLLGIMKKELDTVVWLGAVIGFVIGGVNILI